MHALLGSLIQVRLGQGGAPSESELHLFLRLLLQQLGTATTAEISALLRSIGPNMPTAPRVFLT